MTRELPPDRNDPPGLSLIPLDMERCRSLARHFVESTAAHSRSRGWIPMVKLDLHHIPMNGGEEEVLELILDREAIRGLRLALAVAIDRADEDATRGIRMEWTR